MNTALELQKGYRALLNLAETQDTSTLPLIREANETLGQALTAFREDLDGSMTALPEEKRIFRFEYDTLVRLAADNGIADNNIFERVKKCSGGRVTELELGFLDLTDISSLAALEKLQVLALEFNKISGIACLAGLTDLRELNLRGNLLTDLSALAGLTSLRWLCLKVNNLTDTKCVAGLTGLEVLIMGHNHITDISDLAGLTNLQRLHLDYNRLTNADCLAGLTKLKKLMLNGNFIKDFSSLSGLEAAGCKITKKSRRTPRFGHHI